MIISSLTSSSYAHGCILHSTLYVSASCALKFPRAQSTYTCTKFAALIFTGDPKWLKCNNATEIDSFARIDSVPAFTSTNKIARQPELIRDANIVSICNAWCGADTACIAFTLSVAGNGFYNCTLLSDARGPYVPVPAGSNNLKTSTYPLFSCDKTERGEAHIAHACSCTQMLTYDDCLQKSLFV